MVVLVGAGCSATATRSFVLVVRATAALLHLQPPLATVDD
jgi:hypothetical protein